MNILGVVLFGLFCVLNLLMLWYGILIVNNYVDVNYYLEELKIFIFYILRFFYFLFFCGVNIFLLFIF